jgi:hypothetical protein
VLLKRLSDLDGHQAQILQDPGVVAGRQRGEQSIL